VSELVYAARPVDVGTIEIVYPTDDQLVEIHGWGPAPVNHLWIYLKEGHDRSSAMSVATALGGTVIGEIAALDAYQIQTADTTAQELLLTIERAAALDQVELAMPHFKASLELGSVSVSVCEPQRNPNYEGIHGRPHEMIGLSDAWRMLRASGLEIKPVTVGVLDSSLWLSSGDFNHRGGPRAVVLDAARDVAPAPEVDQEGNYDLTHATKVAHVIAADHRVGGPVGVASVIGDKLTLIGMSYLDGEPSLKALEPAGDEVAETMVVYQGTTYLVRSLASFLELVAAGAEVINCSFGLRHYPPDDPRTQTNAAVRNAWHRLLFRLFMQQPRVLVVAAAGNHNVGLSPTTNWGFGTGNLITVGSCDTNGRKASFSNTSGENAWIDLASPGTSIVVGVTPAGDSLTSAGTSYSAPLVAGAAAILRSIKSDLTSGEIQWILMETATPSIRDAAGTQTVTIPAEISGRLLRVDKAVLHVVNMVRQTKGEPAVTRDELLAMGGFAATVTGGPQDYSVTVTAEYVGEVPTDLTLELVSGEATISGQASQKLTAPGEATWMLRRTGTAQDLLTLKVQRLPVEICAIVRVPYVEPARIGHTSAISVKANVDFARTATPGTYDSGTILTFEIPVSKPDAGYTHTYTWDGALLTARHEGETPTTSVTETIQAEAAPDGKTLVWLELLREEHSKGGPLSTWSRRVTMVRFTDLVLAETGTAFGLELERDALAARIAESYRRTEDSSGTMIDSWVVMRCNSLRVEIKKAR